MCVSVYAPTCDVVWFGFSALFCVFVCSCECCRCCACDYVLVCFVSHVLCEVVLYACLLVCVVFLVCRCACVLCVSLLCGCVVCL